MAAEGAWFASSVLTTLKDHPLGTVGTLAAAAMRLVPHTWNMTPTATMCMFAGARLGKFNTTAAVLLCLFSLVISDILIGLMDINAPWNTDHSFVAFGSWTPFSYLAYFIDGVLGFFLLQATSSILPVAGTSVASSTQFYIISNFGVWIASDFYPRNFAGLIACYTAALPFYGWMLLGDLLYSTIWFSVHKYLTSVYAKFAGEKVGTKSQTDSVSVPEQETAPLLTTPRVPAQSV